MRFRVSSALGALLLVTACGGEDLVLPEDGIPSTITIVSGNPQNGTVGTALASPLVVRVLDAAGRPVPGQQVTFSVLSGGGSVSPAAPTTGADGQTSTSWTLGAGAGAQQVQAKATGGAAPDDLVVLFNAVAGASAAANLVEVSGGGQSATAGSTLPDSLIVRATDAANNAVAGVAVTWTVAGGGSVSDATTVTGVDGRTGVRLTLGVVAGAQSATATSAGLAGSPITFAATATVGTAGKLAINRQPSASAASGAVFSQQPRIQIQDANGNNVAAAGRAISVELIGAGTLNGATTVSTNSQGLAGFSNLSITGPAGSYTLNFTGTFLGEDFTGVTSEPITLTAGAASKLAFTTQPSATTAGASITPAVRVTIQDALGQTASGATNAVTLSLGSNPGGGTLSGTTTVNAVNGVATFANVSINNAGTGYTLTASATGLTGATSTAFNVLTGAATTLAASTSPSAATVAGGTVAPTPAVRATDASGNPVAGVAVTFTAVNGGSVSGESQTTNAAGIAAVGSWTIGPTAGTAYQLQAAAGGLNGSPVTFTTTATAGSAGQLTIETQPAATAQSGVALSPQPAVQLRDAIGNPVSTSGVSITASIATGPGGTLTNATATTNGTGRATFSGLAITGASGTYALSFSGPSISGVVSNDIVLGSGAAAKLGITTQASATVQNGVAFAQQPVLQLQDASGNPVGVSGVTVTAVLQPGSGATLGGDLSVTTNSSGVATFTDLRITGNLAPRTILFASTGLTSVASNSIAVTPGAVSASQSSVTRSPASFVAGDAAGTSLTVTVKDASGNPVPGALVEPASTGNGAFDPASAGTNASGVATFTYTNTSAGVKTLSAVAAGVLLDAQPQVTVEPGAPSAGQSSLQLSPATITAGGSGSTASVTVRDQFSNLVPGAAVTIDATGANSGVPASGSADGSGVFSTVITSSEAGDKTVTATVGGAPLPAQTLTVAAGSPSQAQSSLGLAQPQVVAYGAAVTGSFTLRDAGGNPLGGVPVAFTSLTPFGAITSADAVTSAAGVASFAYEGSRFGADTLVASAGQFSMRRTIPIVTAPVDLAATNLSYTDMPTDPEPDQMIELRADVHGPGGSDIGGARVDFEITGEDLTFADPQGPQWTSDPAGGPTYVVELVKTTKAQTYAVRALVNGVDSGKQLLVKVRPRTPSFAQSTVVADPTQIAAGGTSTITVQLRDQFGNGVPLWQVELSTPVTGASFVQPPAPTGDDGIAVGTFSAAAAGSYQVSATFGGDITLPQQPVVEVTN